MSDTTSLATPVLTDTDSRPAVEIAVVKAPRTPKALPATVDTKSAALKSTREAAPKTLPATLTGPAAPRPAAAPAKAKAPIVRKIAAGSRIDPAAIVTVDVECPKIPGNKNYDRWQAGYPKLGQSATVKDILAVVGGPTVGDLLYDHERAFITITPAPARPK
jgi:hypothetical protein